MKKIKLFNMNKFYSAQSRWAAIFLLFFSMLLFIYSCAQVSSKGVEDAKVIGEDKKTVKADIVKGKVLIKGGEPTFFNETDDAVRSPSKKSFKALESKDVPPPINLGELSGTVPSIIESEEMLSSDLGGVSRPSKAERKRANVQSHSGLKAGFADDNRQFNYFIEFLKKYKNEVLHFPLPVDERIILRVYDRNLRAVPNAQVKIFADTKEIDSGKTYADGTFLFFPSESPTNAKEYTAVISSMQEEKKIRVYRQGKREIDVTFDFVRPAFDAVPLDILFILDTTGSMGEEINRLKKTIEIIHLNLTSLPSRPNVRFGMVLYKDQKDLYVTKVIPLTSNMGAFQIELGKVIAQGGGDSPEDLQSALKDSMKNIKWNPKGVRLAFIITDAAPHLDYDAPYTYVDSAHDAKRRGIKVFTVGTGGLPLTGEYILRQISQYTYGKYIFLTYGEKGESSGGKPGSVSHHTGSNYQTDKLEAIIIRFAKEELAYLSDSLVKGGEEYFSAIKVKEEEREATLNTLFNRAVSQLIDYSSVPIASKTPLGIVPITSSDLKRPTAINAEYFTQQLTLSLNKNKFFTVVDRTKMQEILEEQKIQMSGLVDEKKAVIIGKFIGAQMLAAGSLVKNDEQYILFLRLIRVETGEVLSVSKLKISLLLGI